MGLVEELGLPTVTALDVVGVAMVLDEGPVGAY